MRYLSLFSGIEAATVAWEKELGWECVGVAEIEPFPCEVLKQHYPNVPNLGSVTDITEQRIKELGHIDVVCYGFPCQDLSVAGKRKGLKDATGNVTRSGLFWDALKIIDWSGARWSIAENVPGLLSSNEGLDFATVVGDLAGGEISPPREGWENSGFFLGERGLVEWGILDARYFGVAQRRRRIFIVRDTGAWQSRPPILLEPESMHRHIKKSEKPRQGAAGDASEGSSECGRCYSTPALGDIREDNTASTLARNSGGGGETQNPAFVMDDGVPDVAKCIRTPTGGIDREDMHTLIPDTAGCLQERDHKGPKATPKPGHLIPVICRASDQANAETLEECAPCLSCNKGSKPIISQHEEIKESLPKVVGALCDGAHNGGGANGQDAYTGRIIPCEPHDAKYFESHPNDSRVTGPHDVANAVVSRYGTGGGNCPLVQEGAICIQGGGETSQTSNGDGINKEKTFTLNGTDKHAVCFQQNQRDEVRKMGKDGEIAGALAAEPGAKGQNYIAYNIDAEASNSMKSSNPDSGVHKTDVARCVDTTTQDPSKKQGGTCVAFSSNMSEPDATEEATPPVKQGGNSGRGNPPAVAFDTYNYAEGGETSQSIRTNSSPEHTGTVLQPSAMRAQVRRLTPRECERLQGFPDDYTLIEWKGKPKDKCPDGPRYKALGNSMAVPVMRWIGKQIARAVTISNTGSNTND